MNDFPIKIIKTGVSVCSPSWTTFNEITVPFFRIYYIDRGSGMLTIRGICYKLLPGWIYFIPGVYPFLNKCPKEMKVYWLHGLPVHPEFERFIARIDKVQCWKMSSLNFYKKIILSLGSIDIAGQCSEWMELQSFVTLIISKLLNLYGQNLSWGIPSNIRKSIEYMDSHYIENPSLPQVASIACLAPVYFHRLFKKYCGTTPHAYMEKKRIIMAQSILCSTDKTLNEIAVATGYDNSFYFSRVFKKYFKTSPGMARKINSSP